MNSIDYLRATYHEQPFEVSIETQASCNAACTFCPYPMIERKHLQLSLDKLKGLIEEMSTFRESFYISPFKVSDPLLDSRMHWFCESIEERIPKAKIRLFTNGSMLTAAQINWIQALKRLDHLWISLNSCDPDEYAELMGLRYAITERCLNELHARVLEQSFRHAVVISRVSDSKDGQSSVGDQRFVRDVERQWPQFTPMMIKRDGWLGYVTPSHPAIPATPCVRWWELSIMADGRAALCCMDGKGEFTVGNVYEHTLLEIYNQPVLQRRRWRAQTREGIEPCARCTY